MASSMPNMSEDVLRLNRDVIATLGGFGIEPTQTTSKYKAVRTGHYHSRKEARYAADLELRRKAGEISFWLEQVPFRLPGDTVYRLDFAVFEKFDEFGGNLLWRIKWVEVKGKDLQLGKIKRKQTEELYGIRIELV
jgi:hypothetical protein